jgi:hypothetical protein
MTPPTSARAESRNACGRAAAAGYLPSVFRRSQWEPSRKSMYSEGRMWRRPATAVVLTNTEDSCQFCDEFSRSSSPVAYVRMRHLMNHLVERHGFRLEPRGPEDHYAFESADGEPCFRLATRRRLRCDDIDIPSDAPLLITRRWAIQSRPPFLRNRIRAWERHVAAVRLRKAQTRRLRDAERADVIRDVDRIIVLLSAPLPPAPSLRARLVDWAAEKKKRRRRWRRQWVETFGDVRRGLVRGAIAFEGEAHHLARWMAWDDYLRTETAEIQSLASDIQRGLARMTFSGDWRD